MVVVSTVRSRLAARLASVTGLNALTHWPDNLTGVAVAVQPPRETFMQRITIGGGKELFWDVVLLVPFSTGGDVRAQQTIDGYLDDTGATSIWQAIEGTGGNAVTLDGSVADVEIQQVFGYGAIWTIGSASFMSVSWRVKVMV